MKIELEDLFLASINDGFNLFLGAGFSILAQDKLGQSLPLGSSLKDELSKKFNLHANLSLPKISTVLEATRKQEFYDYIRLRFSVGEYYENYNIITNFSIKSIFTTNVDNLINKIFEKSHTHYLNDIIEFGPSFRDKVAVNFIPLHGSILHESRKLVFSTIDIASAFNNEQNVWHYLRAKTIEYPTLFWGYSLDDSGVIEALFNQKEKIKTNKPKWILLHEEEEASISYFKALGFNIIIGDTKEMLDWFSRQHQSDKSDNLKLINDSKEVFFGLNLPQRESNLPVRPLKNFFMGDIPFWSDIYNNRIPRIHHYNELLNLLHKKEYDNIILTGIPACGKTTLMMQLAASYEFNGHKLICSGINLNKAKLIADRLMGEPAIIFIDNFADDIDVYNYFAQRPNIRLFGVDREYYLEIIIHKLNKNENNKTYIYNCTELDTIDVQLIYDNIPNEVRNQRLKTSSEGSDEMSMFEMVNLNITGPTINDRYHEVIDELDDSDFLALDLLIMICYVNRCRTIVSFDMMSLFLDDDIENYNDIYDLLKILGRLITDYRGNITRENQDYFIPRSSIVAEKIIDLTPIKIFKDVYTRFHEKVPHYSIHRFDIFKKSAYDAFFTKKAFQKWEEGLAFYEGITEFDPSPFVYQQSALYLLYKRRYQEAFNWIDTALIKADRYLYSIKNTHAVIMFEANINSSDPHSVKSYLDDSMGILEGCYNDDKRKLYHAITYGRHAVKYFSLFGDKKSQEYLLKANQWLKEELRENPWNKSVKNVMSDIKNIVH
jgi:hypothetical protein